MAKALTPRRLWMARAIAVTADAAQWVFLPLFVGGAPEGFDAALDAGVGAALCWICGFHPAFLPAFVAEALPGVDLVPSWTLAVLYATRDRPVLTAGAVPPPALPSAEPNAAVDSSQARQR